MKKYKHFFNALIISAFCLVMLFACKKDNGDIVYSQRPASNNLFLSISGTGNLNRTQNLTTLSTTGGTAAVGLNLTKAAGADITATIGVDTTKLSTYNAANGKQFRLLPAANYDLQAPSNGISIKAGSLFSTDSLKINFKNLKGLRASNYLLPVTILKVSGDKSVILSDSVKTVYINLTLSDVTQPSVSISTANGNLTALTFPVGTKGAATPIPFTLQVSPASPNNITVNIAADNSKITGYGSGYTAFPDGSYTLSANSVAVNAGQSGTLNVNIADISKFDVTKIYLLPVSIGKITGDDFVLNGTGTAYLKLSFSNLNNANNTSASGTKLLDKTGWSANASSSFDGTLFGGNNYPPSNGIDSDNTTDWVSDYFKSGTNQNITVDMGSSRNVQTISYNKAYSNILLAFGISTYPSSVNVYTSTNGTDWISQGQYQPVADNGGSTSSPVINYINFFKAIPARYIRLEVAAPGGFAEINVYE